MIRKMVWALLLFQLFNHLIGVQCRVFRAIHARLPPALPPKRRFEDKAYEVALRLSGVFFPSPATKLRITSPPPGLSIRHVVEWCAYRSSIQKPFCPLLSREF